MKIQPKSFPPMDLSDVLHKLDMISQSMNQIAVSAHALNLIDAPLYLENSELLQREIAEIMRQIYR